ncbi:hypothetical protein DMUE_5174 [Dictyocoela muelleri]|nr:hypothetical protein DMUE_5174 [Dictyocoela muelleri]
MFCVDNIIVEIDESKFGKPKYNRGHKVNETWVLGGVERTEKRKIFLEVFDKINKDFLTEIIKKYVQKGSIIHTSMWRGYNDLCNDFTHFTVNHSHEFVNKENGAHTNLIKGTWHAVKSFVSKNYFSKINMTYLLYLFTFMRNTGEDSIKKLIKLLIKDLILLFNVFCRG